MFGRTKDVDVKTDLCGKEAINIGCAEIFFQMLAEDSYSVKFQTQLGNDR